MTEEYSLLHWMAFHYDKFAVRSCLAEISWITFLEEKMAPSSWDWNVRPVDHDCLKTAPSIQWLTPACTGSACKWEAGLFSYSIQIQRWLVVGDSRCATDQLFSLTFIYPSMAASRLRSRLVIGDSTSSRLLQSTRCASRVLRFSLFLSVPRKQESCCWTLF